MSKLSDYLRLMRISLIPTAWSNVLMGFAVGIGVSNLFEFWPQLLAVLICSSCLYIAGMVLNDVYDIDIDRVERPERVIPGGKINLRHAKMFGYSLITIALILAAFISIEFGFRNGGGWTLMAPTFPIAVGLAILILFYNRLAKHTAFGPLVMGACRMFNVLLGASLTQASFDINGTGQGLFYVALAIGLFVAGITWFAKHENSTGRNITLYLGAGCMTLAVAGLAAFPFTDAFWNGIFASNLAGSNRTPTLFMGILALMVFPVAKRVILAMTTCQPRDIKLAVITSLLTIIMIDASICYLVSPMAPAYAVTVACLIIPAFLMCRRIMAT